MRSFQIYQQATPAQQNRLESIAKEIAAFEREALITDAKLLHLKGHLSDVCKDIEKAEKELDSYLEELRKEMNQ